MKENFYLMTSQGKLVIFFPYFLTFWSGSLCLNLLTRKNQFYLDKLFKIHRPGEHQYAVIGWALSVLPEV